MKTGILLAFATLGGGASAQSLEGESLAKAAMGKALRSLKSPIGEVLSSPTYRALETVKYAQLGNARTYAELGDNGRSMQGGTEAQAAWLRERVKQCPKGAPCHPHCRSGRFGHRD